MTFASNILRQGAQLLVGFVITPVVIRGLGAELYGAWQMVEQAVQYLARSDLRPMGTLRYFISVRQHSEDLEEKKRLVGSALLVSLFMSPLILSVGAGLVWATPLFIKVVPEYEWAVKVTMAIAVLRIVFDKVFGVPASILAGENLEYKAMGLNAFTVLVGGGISFLAIEIGWGLPGVASAALVAVLINGITRLIIAKKYVPWLGVSRPAKAEVLFFSKSSGWLFGSSIADAFLNVSDMLIIGMVLGPTSAGIYAATSAVLRLSVPPITQMLTSASAGLGELCGRKEWQRVLSIRYEMHIFSLVMMTIAGVGIMSLNKAFLNLWVGRGFYCGDPVNLVLVLVAIFKTIVRTDSMLLDNLLILREKSIAYLICGVFNFCFGFILTYFLGIIGMVCALLLSQIGLLFYTASLVNKKLCREKKIDYSLLRLSSVSAVLMLFAYVFSNYIAPDDWLSFFSIAIIVALFASIFIWFFGLNEKIKISIKLRFSTLVKRKVCC